MHDRTVPTHTVTGERFVALTIYGNLASKSNSRRLVTIGGKPRSIKSERAQSFEQTAGYQINGNHRLGLTGPIKLEAIIYYSSRRPDLDESLLMDILERTGVYKNDRQIVEKHIYKRLDTITPRVEVSVTELKTAGK